MSIALYNKLPLPLKKIENAETFTKSLKEFLISKCYYNLQEFLSDKI